MKVIATLFLVATVLFGITIASLNIPIIGWSSNKVFTKSEIIESYSADQFKELLVSLIKGSESDIVSASKPEIITIFVEQQLRTDELSTLFDSYSEKPQSNLQSLKDNIEHAASSIYIPYTTTSGSLVSSVVKAVSSSLKGSLVVASDSEFTIEGAEHITLNNVQNTLNHLIANKNVDILVVLMPSQNQNKIVSIVNNLLKGVEHVSFFTGENATPLDFALEFEPIQEKLVSFSMLANSNSSSNSSSSGSPNATDGDDYFNYFPGPVIEAYLVVFILLTIFFIGLCCILDLQVPDRYEAPKQKIL